MYFMLKRLEIPLFLPLKVDYLSYKVFQGQDVIPETCYSVSCISFGLRYFYAFQWYIISVWVQSRFSLIPEKVR